MKNTKALLMITTLLLTSANSFADSQDIANAYSYTSGNATYFTLTIPLSPAITSVELSEYDEKIVVAAKEDAVYFVSGGEKTVRLTKALHIIRSATNDFQTSDQDLAIAILGQ